MLPLHSLPIKVKHSVGIVSSCVSGLTLINPDKEARTVLLLGYLLISTLEMGFE